MSTHEAGGRSVMLHSVCVDESMRRKGLATALLRAYIDRLRQRDDVDRVRLLAHDELIGLYESAGFGLIGKSGVEHGSRPWFELGIEMRHPSPGLPFGARSMTAVLADEGKTARADLFCPRAACRSFILRASHASLVERDPTPVRDSAFASSDALSSLRSTPSLSRRDPTSRRRPHRRNSGSSPRHPR